MIGINKKNKIIQKNNIKNYLTMLSGTDEFVSFMEGLSLKMCKIFKIRRLAKSGAESKIVNPPVETGVLHVPS